MSGDKIKPGVGSCRRCGQPMQRRSEPRTPGFVYAKTITLCRGCYAREWREINGYQPPQIPIQLPPVEVLEAALCAQIGPGVDGVFFPDAGDNSSVYLAKSVCSACPVIDGCREWALANHEPYGVWGGLSPNDRRQILKERRHAA